MTPEGRALVAELARLADAPDDGDDVALDRLRARLLRVTSGGDTLDAVDLLHHGTYEGQWSRGRRRGLAAGRDAADAVLLSDVVERILCEVTDEQAEEIGLDRAQLEAALHGVWGLLVALERAVDDPRRSATAEELDRGLAAELRGLRHYRETGDRLL